jgi:hypothetical protein
MPGRLKRRKMIRPGVTNRVLLQVHTMHVEPNTGHYTDVLARGDQSRSLICAQVAAKNAFRF